jgi:hypothetical protein
MKGRPLSSFYPHILSSKLLYGFVGVQYWVFLDLGKGILGATFGSLKLKMNYVK